MPLNCYYGDQRTWKFLKGLEKRKTPASDYFFEIFKREVRDIAINEEFADQLFDNLEFKIGLEFAFLRYSEGRSHSGSVWFPVGRFIWKENAASGGENLLNQINQLSSEDPYFKAGLFGGSVEKAMPVSEAVKIFMNHMATSLMFS